MAEHESLVELVGTVTAGLAAVALLLLGAVLIPRSKPTAGGPMLMH